MGSYDNEPGGGYRDVKGYEPPAGSQAEQERQFREDAARQQQQQQQAYDAAQVQSAAPASSASARRSGSVNRQQKPAPGPRGRGAHAAPATPAQGSSKDWSPFLATIACIATCVWVAGRIEGDHAWWTALAAGLFVGWIVGRFYKAIIVVFVVGVVLIIVARNNENKDAEGVAQPELFEPSPLATTVAPLPDIEIPPLFAANRSALLPGTTGTIFGPGDVDVIELRGLPKHFGTLYIRHATPVDFPPAMHAEYDPRFHRVALHTTASSRLDLGLTLDADLDLTGWGSLFLVAEEYSNGQVVKNRTYFLREVQAGESK